MKNFIIALFCIICMEVCSMSEVALVPQCDFGKLKIQSLMAPAWVYDPKYSSDEAVLKDRTICDAIKTSDPSNFYSEENLSLFWEAGIESGEKFGLMAVRDMERVMEHISLIATENGDLEHSPSVRFLYSSSGLFEYFSSVVFFEGKPVTSKLWEKVSIIFTAFRDSIGESASEDEGCRPGYLGRIKYVTSTTPEWPTKHFLSWAIARAISDSKI
jgi:hypothetical protein